MVAGFLDCGLYKNLTFNYLAHFVVGIQLPGKYLNTQGFLIEVQQTLSGLTVKVTRRLLNIYI